MNAPLATLVLCFAAAGYVTVQANRTPRFAQTPALTAELEALLQDQGLSRVPLDDPPGKIIDAALRFDLPDCPIDAFLLPLPDASLTGVQAIRFTELTGTTYRATSQNASGADTPLNARAARWLATLRAVFGLPAARNSHTVLTIFMPLDCPARAPDLGAFWHMRPPQQ